VRIGRTARLSVALALLAVVAVASTAELDRYESPSTGRVAWVLLLTGFVAALAIGFGAVALGGGYAVFGGNRRRTNLILTFVTTAVLAAVLAIALAPIEGLAPRGIVRGARPAGGRRRGADDDPWIGDETFATTATVVAVAALVAALVVASILAVLARHRRTVDVAADDEQLVIDAVEESLDDLRREPDVRRAIIACYARVELALERAGSGRRPAEAPFEYLVRILERITANGRAARSLTALFEQAKFSTEPMGESDKQRAIEALELLRAELVQPR
jgi:hypothetical protein